MLLSSPALLSCLAKKSTEVEQTFVIILRSILLLYSPANRMTAPPNNTQGMVVMCLHLFSSGLKDTDNAKQAYLANSPFTPMNKTPPWRCEGFTHIHTSDFRCYPGTQNSNWRVLEVIHLGQIGLDTFYYWTFKNKVLKAWLLFLGAACDIEENP